MVIRFMMMQNGDVIKKTWIILDDLYKDRVTNNLGYVEDVNNCAKHEEIIVLMNGGSLMFYQKGRLIFLPLNVHVSMNFLEKILSLKNVKKFQECVGLCINQ